LHGTIRAPDRSGQRIAIMHITKQNHHSALA
jgi:hypothetical protein